MKEEHGRHKRGEDEGRNRRHGSSGQRKKQEAEDDERERAYPSNLRVVLQKKHSEMSATNRRKRPIRTITRKHMDTSVSEGSEWSKWRGEWSGVVEYSGVEWSGVERSE